MYSLIIDGEENSAKGTFENFGDALFWYDYALNNGVSSIALWCDQVLIKFEVNNE